jgi:hypothetical protein
MNFRYVPNVGDVCVYKGPLLISGVFLDGTTVRCSAVDIKDGTLSGARFICMGEELNGISIYLNEKQIFWSIHKQPSS